MFKWIKNSKGDRNNKSTGLKGINITEHGKYKATVRVRNKGAYKEAKQVILYIGSYSTIKEAKKARVDYILGLL